MNSPIRAKALPFAIATLLAVGAAPAIAQNVTSSAVAGQVVDASGQPVANATVTIVHEPSGTTKVVSTDASGRYVAQGLRVGGPFDITAAKSGLNQGEQDNVYLQLGQTSAVNLKMAAVEAQNLGGVTVTASALMQTFTPDNKGLSTNVSGRQLESTPQGNRSIDDIARLDPRINVTDQGDGSISVAGLPNRYNNISVDGISQGDPFGLNANGLPYQGSPISVDTIAEYNISTANFDVVSDTVGADVNAVTKSGTNEFHGSVYYAYRNANKMVGNAGWLDHDEPGYEYTGYARDWTGGITLGGPIVKDKLFFFVSAEQEKTTGIGADSANGLDASLGNGPSTSNKVSPGDLQRVIDTANALGLQPGSFGAGGVTLEDKRYLAKIDWNITNNHRASLTYQYTKETQPIIQGNSSNQIGLSSYWYTKDSLTKNAALQFFDDWTENFSTEAKVSYQSFEQLAGNAINQPQVKVYLDPSGFGPSINLGEDQYRHENAISTKKWSAFLAGTLYLGDHTLKAGIDYQRSKIYNLFGRTEHGNYTFYGLDNFAAGNYDSYFLYQPADGYTLNDVAANWTYTQYSPFLQDTWQVNDNLSLTYGVRVDIPQANKAPLYNPAFEQAFGYPNNTKLGAKNKVVEPRLAFNYAFDTERMTQLRGGFGLFQTSPPTVWMTNPYQNNGLTVASYSSFDPADAAFSPDPYAQNRPAGAGSVSGDVDTIDPNFKLPSVWKTTLAFDRELPWWGMIGSVELQHFKTRNGIYYQAINIGAPTGVLPDGRFQYWATPGEFPNSRDAAANRNFDFDRASTLLTNTDKGKSDALTLALSKPFSNDWAGSLAFTMSHATEVNPGNSSQASSGYAYVVRENVNDEVAATADRNIAKTIKASLTWQHAFFGDYKTSVSAFYNGHDGLPYSWIFSGDANGDGITYEDPAYIPTLNDSKVAFDGASAQVIQQFQDFISSDDYLNSHRGQIASRNGAHYSWVNELDMSFAQEVPGIFKGNKGVLRLDIYNFLNLLNNDWGQTVNTQFNTRTLAGYNGVNAQGQYLYYLPTDENGNYQPQQLVRYDAGSNPTRVVSRWSAMLTLRYTF
ncbi:carboxypeptidase regulatory-like domain-containing protein [Frateuria edaphi]|uniref:TonB-dependent receptor n=1 Tax=Frateuria edaphi TaxID=2898793 RepID=UPI001E4D80EE|nr:carboxypeptidase regulatory-like domain-containing protein [Frateuria edaphi]UGB46589.1 carboxypeptidase regulatory-like domain-containing protein [Frateuria edaphi]